MYRFKALPRIRMHKKNTEAFNLSFSELQNEDEFQLRAVYKCFTAPDFLGKNPKETYRDEKHEVTKAPKNSVS